LLDRKWWLYLSDTNIETLDHAVGPWRFRRRDAVLENQCGAQLIELMLTSGSDLAYQIKQK